MAKKSFKFLTVIMLVSILILGILLFAGCDDLKNAGRPGAHDGEKTVTVIIGADSYTATTQQEYLHGLLIELDEAGKIEYEYQSGTYISVTKLNALVTASDWSSWIGVYHDIKGVDDANLIVPGYDLTVDSKTYYTSNVGVADLPIVDGATYLFKQN